MLPDLSHIRDARANSKAVTHVAPPPAPGVILAPDVGRLQIALVAAHRVIPITSEP